MNYRALPLLLALAVFGLMAGFSDMGNHYAGAEDAASKTPEYIGTKACKKCHLKQYKSFTKNSPLHTSFENLKPDVAVERKKKHGIDPKKDFSKDPKCLKCHTTGYGTDVGYPAVVEGKAWSEEEKARAALTEGVTCEACHGPSSLLAPFKKENKKYKREEIVALGAIAPVTADNCAPCHVKECPAMPEDYTFDFEKTKDSEKIHVHKKLKNEH